MQLADYGIKRAASGQRRNVELLRDENLTLNHSHRPTHAFGCRFVARGDIW